MWMTNRQSKERDIIHNVDSIECCSGMLSRCQSHVSYETPLGHCDRELMYTLLSHYIERCSVSLTAKEDLCCR